MAQTGAIRGKILDKATKEPLPFASVVAEMNGTQVGGAHWILMVNIPSNHCNQELIPLKLLMLVTPT